MKYLFILLTLFSASLINAQTNTSKKEKKVIEIDKKIDKDGNEVIEKKVLEGEAAEKYMKENKESGNSFKMSSDSSGRKTKIVISEDINIKEDDDEDSFMGNKKTYTDRTVVIKKNADGSVEIKDKAGEDLAKYMTVDSTEAKKPNIGVALDDDMRIINVYKDGAAAAAGVERNDVLTHFDGTFIEDYDHLKTLLAKKKVGDKVVITYLRDRKEVKTNIILKGGSTRVYFNR